LIEGFNSDLFEITGIWVVTCAEDNTKGISRKVLTERMIDSLAYFRIAKENSRWCASCILMNGNQKIRNV
jgi:hypothetical protein